jgi:hypothetical protein
MSPSAKVPLAILFVFLIGALVVLAPASSPPAQTLDDACWTGTWEQFPRFDPMYLVQNGTTVSGNYDWDWGRLRGTIDGDKLRGEWAEWPTYAPPSDAGTFEFTMRPGCNEFYGHYYYGTDPEWNDWTGERIDAPGRVAMQVSEPTVSYRGLEVQPGDTFFPDTCASERGATDEPCEDTMTFEERLGRQQAAEVLARCVYNKIKNVIAIVEQANLNEDEEALVLAIALVKGYEKCVFGNTREPAELDLELTQGVARISGQSEGQTLRVDVQVATAASSGPGTFIAGYHPQTNEAVFTAFSAPLTVTPRDGAPLILPPFHEVTLTPGGFGPMEELPLLYMPVVVNR